MLFLRGIGIGVCGGFVWICMTAVPVAAQEPARTFADIQGRMTAGDRVQVTDREGSEIRGEVEEVSGTSLALSVEGTRRVFSETDVRSIERRTHASRLAGALIGGLGAGLTGWGICSSGARSESFCGEETPSAAIFGVYAGFGAAAGVIVASIIPQSETVFSVSDSVSVKIMPVFTLREAAVGVSFSF